MSFFILAGALLLSSCSEDSVTNNPPAPSADFKYPFKINSFWYYTTRNFVTNLRPDSISNYFTTDTTIGYGGAKFIKDTIVNGDTLKLLSNEHSTSGHSHTTLEYYNQTDSGLMRIAFYSDGVNFGPYRPGESKFTFNINGKSFNSVNELIRSYDTPSTGDSLVYDDPPVRVLLYPITLNTEWDFVTFGTTRITKKYTDFETVTVPAGSFYCAKIRRNWYYNSSAADPRFISYDYFSKEGMIKRDFIIKDVAVSDTVGTPIGLIDVKEEAEINLYTLP